jgi:ABC-2 type transport system permease protein
VTDATEIPVTTPVSPTRAFAAVLWRDLFVTGRDLAAFLAQVVLQPFFLIFVFGKVLTQLGYAQEGYAELLLPGVIALTAVLTGLQGTALPLVIDFSFTKEIEDRLLAPMPISWVAIEKIVYGAFRSLIAAILMFPIGWLVLGSVPFTWSALPLTAVVLVLGAFVGAAMGLTLGTLVQPQKINIVFALVLTPLLFTGASQYPWPALASLRWFQIVTLFNPLTYVSEGLRAALVPDVPHIAVWICLAVLIGSVALFGWVGMRGFDRRAID